MSVRSDDALAPIRARLRELEGENEALENNHGELLAKLHRAHDLLRQLRNEARLSDGMLPAITILLDEDDER